MVKYIKGFIIVTAVAFVCFILSILAHNDYWADLTAPLFDMLAAGLIFYAVWTSPNKQFRAAFILAGTAALLWGLADITWYIIDELFLMDPDGNTLILVLSIGTKIALAATMMIYAYSRLRIWDTVQLVLDGVIFAAAILWSVWHFLYNKNFAQFQMLVHTSIVNTLMVILDITLLIIIGIWYLSIRKGTLPVFLRLLVGSISLFAVSDLVYYHLYSRGEYIPDSLLDVSYLTGLLGIAASVVLFYAKYPAQYEDPNPNTNIGHKHKGLLLLLLFPVSLGLFHSLDGTDVIVYVILILLYETAGGYIQSAIRNKALLNQEIDMNKKLERLVAEQTEDLQSANDELRRRNEELNYANLHDSLTGLYNRTYFLGKLEEAIREAKPDVQIALLFWNIDSLKGINDTYGHSTGDEVLIQHARRVEKLFQNKGTLARFTSNEFVFFFHGQFDDRSLMQIAGQVIATSKKPMRIGEYSFIITVSVGIAVYPVCATDYNQLLKNADIAMKFAQATRPDTHIAKYMDIDKAVERRTLIANHLETLDADRELTLYYQPQFRMADKALVGMEALLRWNSPNLGSIPPDEFIPIAESINQIIPIGNWVLENAVSQIAAWNRAYPYSLRMGINISPKQFDQVATFNLLDEAILRYEAKAEWIDIEITEGVALDNESGAKTIKKYLRSKGISVSIDDFGTGYSSMGYLSIQSFDRLKIAKPLIDRITNGESHRKIVASIILLAKSLDLQTLAEGVETKAQFDLLLSLGCDQIQGYYLGRPEPAEIFEAKYLKPLAGGDASQCPAISE